MSDFSLTMYGQEVQPWVLHGGCRTVSMPSARLENGGFKGCAWFISNIVSQKPPVVFSLLVMDSCDVPARFVANQSPRRASDKDRAWPWSRLLQQHLSITKSSHSAPRNRKSSKQPQLNHTTTTTTLQTLKHPHQSSLQTNLGHHNRGPLPRYNRHRRKKHARHRPRERSSWFISCEEPSWNSSPKGERNPHPSVLSPLTLGIMVTMESP